MDEPDLGRPADTGLEKPDLGRPVGTGLEKPDLGRPADTELDEKLDIKRPMSIGLDEKPMLGRPMSTVLEEVKETDEDCSDSEWRLSFGNVRQLYTLLYHDLTTRHYRCYGRYLWCSRQKRGLSAD